MRHSALVESRAYWLTRFILALSQTSTTMSLSNTKIVSLSRSPVGEPTQVNQSFFPGASNIIISGGQFTNVAGDFVIHPEHWDRAEVEHILRQLVKTHLEQRSIADGNVGYSHENGGVTIIDALGEKLVFPPSIMALFSDAHDNLLKHFRGKLGEDRVHSGRYCLVKQDDGMRVDERDWNTVVGAGGILVMCILIEKVWVASRKQTCPKCGDTRLGMQRDGGFYVCRRCRKRFTFERAPKARRIRPPSKDDNTVATFVNVRKEFVKNDDVVTLLSRKYVAARLESSESTTDHFAFLPSSGMYVAARFESSDSTTDHFAFLLSSCWYVTARLESSDSTTDHFAFLLSRTQYVAARFESSDSITDHFAFLLSRNGYVAARFQSNDSTTDHFAFLLSRKMYVAARLESSESTTDHFVFLLSSCWYVTARLESSESTTDHFAFLLSRKKYVAVRLESSESTTDHFAFLLSSWTYVAVRLESSESTTDHFAFLLSRQYVAARFESSDSITDHFAFLLSRNGYVAARFESNDSTTDHFAFLLSRKTYVAARLESSDSTIDHFVFLLFRWKYVAARLESSDSTTDHFAFLLSSGKYVAARLESSDSTTDHFVFLLSRKYVVVQSFSLVCLLILPAHLHYSKVWLSVAKPQDLKKWSKRKRKIMKYADKLVCLPRNISSTDANFPLQQFMTTIHIAFGLQL
ncbi:hypothetical protein D9613_003560 [Agrocybe pediades]|uniref:Ubiquitin-like domain-containing protein n=1 Tax=Agrocybe pediades TaxID=84607 RepID=A0A8H4QRM6_9AGAR|nr:hypothetical protein D9613_003560 [Agrocybe pediades]